ANVMLLDEALNSAASCFCQGGARKRNLAPCRGPRPTARQSVSSRNLATSLSPRNLPPRDLPPRDRALLPRVVHQRATRRARSAARSGEPRLVGDGGLARGGSPGQAAAQRREGTASPMLLSGWVAVHRGVYGWQGRTERPICPTSRRACPARAPSKGPQ